MVVAPLASPDGVLQSETEPRHEGPRESLAGSSHASFLFCFSFFKRHTFII